ncbi:MAG: hypothetical protein H7832_04760 [Magnetococcus sp. DMHC-6]
MIKNLIFAALLLTTPLAYGEDTVSTSADSGSVAPIQKKVQYYTIQPDMRECVSPLCGGYFLSAVNSKTTRCSDGQLQKSCYVARIDWGDIRQDKQTSTILIKGRLIAENFPNFGNLGILIAEQAWHSVRTTPLSNKDSWYQLNSKNIVCVAAPCYNIQENLLNFPTIQALSGVNLNGVKTNKENKAEAFKILATDGLLARGHNQVIRNQGAAGDGLTLVASDFFLPMEQNIDPNLSCDTDSQCTSSPYQHPVSSPEECYCPLCAAPINRDIALENESQWVSQCSTFGFPDDLDKNESLICPAYMCIAQPPVICKDHRCVNATKPLPY